MVTLNENHRVFTFRKMRQTIIGFPPKVTGKSAVHPGNIRRNAVISQHKYTTKRRYIIAYFSRAGSSFVLFGAEGAEPST
jgi:hypothetical protein